MPLSLNYNCIYFSCLLSRHSDRNISLLGDKSLIFFNHVLILTQGIPMVEAEKKTEHPQDKENQSEMKKILEAIDRDFKPRYWRLWLTHYMLESILTILILLILVVVLLTYLSIEYLFTPENIESNIPLFLTSLALVISLTGLLLKWVSSPTTSREDYVNAIAKKNAQEILKKNKFKSSLIFEILVMMKARKPNTKLLDVYKLSPLFFDTDELIRKFYTI